MGTSELKFIITENAHVAKYAEGVTQEQIDSGAVEPLEVVEETRQREATAQEVIALGLDPEAIVRQHQQLEEGM